MPRTIAAGRRFVTKAPMFQRTVLMLPTPQPYAFAGVTDHGWIALAPVTWDEGTQTLTRIEQLSSGQVVRLRLHERAPASEGEICVEIAAAAPLSAVDANEIVVRVRRMLKLDEAFDAFVAHARDHPVIGPLARAGRGRLLRSPTLFEDVVKTICTTNITWTQTKSLVARLVATLGSPLPGSATLRAFPTPAQVAAADPTLFKEEIRLGYRGPYVHELARQVADGALQLEALDDRTLPPQEVRRALKGIKGVGDYAANTLMMIVGHYGHVAIDSEFRTFVQQRYFADAASGDTPISERAMAAVYADWGEWQYLAYWFDSYGEA